MIGNIDLAAWYSKAMPLEYHASKSRVLHNQQRGPRKGMQTLRICPILAYKLIETYGMSFVIYNF